MTNVAGGWQQWIVVLIVVISALVTLKKMLPSLWGRLLAAIATLLQHRYAPRLVQRLGTHLRAAIPTSVGSACASSGSCNSCGACADTPAVEAMPLAAPTFPRR